MSTLENSKSTPNTANLHTAVYVLKYSESATNAEDLKQLCALVNKANSGIKKQA